MAGFAQETEELSTGNRTLALQTCTGCACENQELFLF
jgi:hypothetical protein